MEELYTEAQWSAIKRMDSLSAHFSVFDLLRRDRRRVCGPQYSWGEFWMCWWAETWHSTTLCGPPRGNFVIFEAKSGLVIEWHKRKLEALSIARVCLTKVPAARLFILATKATERTVEHRAKEEERAAAATTRAIEKARKISKRARAVFAASEGKCHYCKTSLELGGKWHIEHKIPRALFGGSEQSNLVASCTKCNHQKRDKTDLEFMAAKAPPTDERGVGAPSSSRDEHT